MSTKVRAETGRTYNSVTNIHVIACAGCSIPFGITTAFEKRRREDHREFYCPSGCVNYYPQESDEEKALRLKGAAETREQAMRDQLRATERDLAAARRSKAAIKGHLTRARRRGGAGLCPVEGCRRHFSNVHRHLSTQHPGFVEGLNT